MAVNSYSPVEFSSDGRPIISSKNALMKCPDGSIHRVPVINCNALKFLQRNYDDDETSSGEEEEAAHASPRASDGAINIYNFNKYLNELCSIFFTWNELYIIVFLGGTYLEKTRGLYLESLLEDHIWKAFFWSTISGKNWWIISGKLFGGSYLLWSTISGLGHIRTSTHRKQNL